MTPPTRSVKNRWGEAWPDALAFAIGLALAWYFQWETRDLVWSLWLSSLVLGYAMIVWNIFGTGAFLARKATADDSVLREVPRNHLAAAGGVMLVGGLFVLAFFTVHFGGFHYVHSVFLNAFFPIDPGGAKSSPGLAVYAEVFLRYWWFLPAAAIAERSAFRLKIAGPEAGPAMAATDGATAQERVRKIKDGLKEGMMRPYKNVMRLHLLIFFFAVAHFTKLDSFLVYVVVYAVYFFPWPLMRSTG